MNRKIINLFKSTALMSVILLFTSCSKNDSDPCANSTLAVTAVAEEYTIKATATGGVEPYEYSIDGTTFQTSDTFTDVESGDYTLTVRDANTCTSTTSVTEADLNSLLDERDGQRYKIVKIGNQIWLGENFNFDTNTTTTTSSWCYNDESTNCDTYGKLYTWEAASQMAPEGWKLPSSSDWYDLINEVGGYDVAHTELMEGDFELLRAGRTNMDGFSYVDEYGWYWTSNAHPYETNWYGFIQFAINSTNQGSTDGSNALSVRLIKIQNN
ncbi:FISUMP domain-containing protein [Mariniflexile sp. HMF6888]|uniref:FISUMP domain-containing protein n=1 Tax=Mariniflexile sp. HMF6888 TaxID=3373086 RepID=UPI0037A7881A